MNPEANGDAAAGKKKGIFIPAADGKNKKYYYSGGFLWLKR
jgi:hypothetical protein